MTSAYPTIEAVDDASDNQILRWIRYLPNPHDSQERSVMDRILERYESSRSTTRRA